MNSRARGLVIADRIPADRWFSELRYGRYSSCDSGDGKRFESRELGLSDLRDIAAANGELWQSSAEQELVENLINDHIAMGGR